MKDMKEFIIKGEKITIYQLPKGVMPSSDSIFKLIRLTTHHKDELREDKNFKEMEKFLNENGGFNLEPYKRL